MAISYKPLWHLLVERDMKKMELVELANITSNVVSRMGKNGYISMESIEKICLALHCTPNDIFECYETLEKGE